MKNYDVFSKNKLNILDVIKILFHYSPIESLILFILNILNAIVPIILLESISKFINDVMVLLAHEFVINKLYTSLFFVLLCFAYMELSPILIDYIHIKLKNNLSETFGIELISRLGSLEYRYFEFEETLDMISRISLNSESFLSDAYINILNTMSLIIKVLGIMIILFIRVPLATLVICFVSLPTFYVANKAGKINYKANIVKEKYERKAEYLSEILTGRESLKERGIFDFSDDINNLWHEQFEISRHIKLKAGLKWLLGSEISGLLTTFLIGLVILVLLKPLKQGNLSVGIFVASINSIILLIPDLSWQLPEYTESLSNSISYLRDFSDLLNLKIDKNYTSYPERESINIRSIEFVDVSFKYPGMNDYILKNLNLKMSGSKNYAFVGKNGSGKSTIIKILTGLYNEFEGEILINGKSIKKYGASELKSMFSVVYQDFAKYGISLRENIELGAINNQYDESNYDKVNSILEELNIFESVQSLPKGIDTNLGKIIEGSVDLSGGQRQKLAIARSLINNRPIRILDEPTASLDPVSELDLYETFKKMNKDKLTIFISHRLASTIFADKIFVIDKGKVVQEGSYEELVNKEGLYRNMFNKQKQWYKDYEKIRK